MLKEKKSCAKDGHVKKKKKKKVEHDQQFLE